MTESGGAAQNTTTPASTEVGWNTIFYTLLPLAMSTMAQPVGSVLGTNPISRTYLRSSPIICAFDALHFIVEIAIYRIYDTDTFRDAITGALEWRFQHGIVSNESFKIFQTQTVVRWVMFLLGTHGCILKLAGATGIPWSQTMGFVYLASFLIFEFAIILRRTESTLRPGVVETTLRTEWESATRAVLFFATIGNSAVLAAGLLGLLKVCPGWYKAMATSTKPTLQPEDVDASQFAVIMSLIFGGFAIHLLVGDPLLSRLVLAWPGLGEQLLVLEKTHAEEIRRNYFYYKDRIRWWTAGSMIELVLVWPLYIFLGNFFVGVLWYRFVYDSTGTSRAVWADIFG